jgi:hypothetical protein
VLDHLDRLLRHLFLTHVPELTSEVQVRFQPPDDEWRAVVSTLTVNGQPAGALNVYLIELRENRALRSAEWASDTSGPNPLRVPAPARVDCHYIITAWSPAAPSPTVEPALDEHRLLHGALAALLANRPLSAARLYPAGSAALSALPDLLRYSDLPALVATVPQDLPRTADFWSTMGSTSRWRPAVHLVVTMPVGLPGQPGSTPVTTRELTIGATGLDVGATGSAGSISVGGRLLSADGAGVAAGRAVLETPGGAPVLTAQADGGGWFTLDGIRPGPYRLRGFAHGFGEAIRHIDVPAADGDYVLTLPAPRPGEGPKPPAHGRA